LHTILKDQSATGTINLVEHNYSINDIVEVLKELYPEMEMIFINNNMKLRELKVDTSTGNLADPAEGLAVLRDRLASFKKEFTF
jgi:UDP-glucose 4-epimerase